MRCGDGLIGCGLDKVRVFQQCVVPPLKEFYAAEAVSKNETMVQADIVGKVIARLQKEGVVIGASLTANVEMK